LEGNTQTQELFSTLKVAFSYSLSVRDLLYSRLNAILKGCVLSAHTKTNMNGTEQTQTNMNDLKISKESLVQLQSIFFDKFQFFFDGLDEDGNVYFIILFIYVFVSLCTNLFIYSFIYCIYLFHLFMYVCNVFISFIYFIYLCLYVMYLFIFLFLKIRNLFRYPNVGKMEAQLMLSQD
jgi:hypothetical protein